MTWNEPGGGGKDPWGSRGNSGDGPPDLGEAMQGLQRKLKGLFGGGGGDDEGGGQDKGPGFLPLLGIVLVLLASIYGFAGIYQVDEREQAVVLRFGAFKEIKGPGLRWDPPLVSRRFVVNTTEERQYETTGLMLTEDEAIVRLPITVQYNVANVRDFVLNVRDPDSSVHQAADSALRHVVGSSELNQVLSGGRAVIGQEVEERIQRYLDHYGAGIAIRDVNMQEGRPPEEVRSAFDDVVRAAEDQERLKSEAQGYANQVIPEARGRAQRMIEEATAYAAQVVARAEGESQRFERLLAEYQQAPEVTRARLYLDAMQDVMEQSSKVMVDVSGGNNMLYLPLDRMGRQAQAGASGGTGNDPGPEAIREITEQVSRDLGRSNSAQRPRNTAPVRREVR